MSAQKLVPEKKKAKQNEQTSKIGTSRTATVEESRPVVPGPRSAVWRQRAFWPRDITGPGARACGLSLVPTAPDQAPPPENAAESLKEGLGGGQAPTVRWVGLGDC